MDSKGRRTPNAVVAPSGISPYDEYMNRPKTTMLDPSSLVCQQYGRENGGPKNPRGESYSMEKRPSYSWAESHVTESAPQESARKI